MALSYPTLIALIELRKTMKLPEETRMLELGEQSWYGDVMASDLLAYIDKFAPDAKKDEFTKEYETIVKDGLTDPARFDLAKLCYKVLLNCRHYDAIDLHGTEASTVKDLNNPIEFEEQYDIVTNFGTAEHVFNIAEVFRTMHKATRPGGVMLHGLPNQGAYDHGFFNFHPTFVFDLCRENNYLLYKFLYVQSAEIPAKLTLLTKREDYVRLAVAGQLATHSGLIAMIIKPQESEFRFPRQGFYDKALSPDVRKAWLEMPR